MVAHAAAFKLGWRWIRTCRRSRLWAERRGL